MTLGITVASRYAEALMLRAKNRNLSLIVVEGASDSRIYRRLLNQRTSQILWLNGKTEALNLIDRFRTTRITGNVGIIDADLDRLNGKKKQGPQIIWTSETDMETMVLRSNAYFRVFPAHTDPDLVDQNRKDLLAISVQLGCLRALSQKRMWSIDFKRLDFEAFVDRVKLTSDVKAMCEEVLRKNPQLLLTVADLTEEVAYFKGTVRDESFVYHGHDLCRILQLCEVRLFGSRTLTFDSIAARFTIDDFNETSTSKELSQWEKENPGFSVSFPVQ